MKKLILFVIPIIFVSCSSGILKYKSDKDIFKNAEFEKKVLIKEPVVDENKGDVTAPDTQASVSKPATPAAPAVKKTVIKIKKGKKVVVVEPVTMAESKTHLPELEDAEGFANVRRPLVDPFKVGEKVKHTVSYFGTSAGYISFSVGPFVEVNGRKSYNFKTEILSSKLFSNFYSVQDKVETYVDYLDLVPHVFKLEIKESGQLKEAQSFFDHTTLKANYWENKYTEKNGHEEKRQSWEIEPYSQNAFSAVYYMRLFKWNVGKEYAFRVADDEKNIVFRGKALEKVTLQTDAGSFEAIKIKAEIVSRGALTQTGDLMVWISDDSHHYILRIEAKIKIGTLVSEITELHPE